MISRNDFEARQLAFAFPCRGDTIHFRNDNIVIKDKDGSIKYQTTCYLLHILFIIGNTSISTTVLEKSSKFCFSLVFMSENFRPYNALYHKAEGNILLRKRQYNINSNDIGANIIANKIVNQRKVLSKIRNKDLDLKNALEKLEELAKIVVTPGLSCQEIMGFEGAAYKIYFHEMFKNHGWTMRCPRAKHDEINCLLDIGYTMLFNIVNSLLEMYGFDTYVGVLHRPFFHRKSLTCDIVEPFRPIIDRAIRKMANLGMIKEKDFYYNQNQYTLFGKPAVPYLRYMTEAILECKNDIYLYIQRYYRAFIQGKEISEYPEFSLEV